ncbi:response regulator [Paenibacillus pasadenensis]|uniref:response regulator transcription factor n=1 Tax=Paenibacillus pasadenensis TaxID=217090 RepID=UPI00203F6CC9|nr:response regulator [Paenibacillus pasadenensis]MCM3748699.1 response regulator [Paenibacillus pasadenensis]
MWKVILVEDELFVRDSIKQLVPWEELGFTLAGEAGDGTAALDIIMQQKPDLVISDIVMPEMDGVMLLKAVRELGMETKFIMLTCMSDFEYARTALELGATSYILKLSMDIDKLKESLRKVALELTKHSNHDRQKLLAKLPPMYEQIWSMISASATGRGQVTGLHELAKSLEAAGIAPSRIAVVLQSIEPDQWNENIHIHRSESLGITTLIDWSGGDGAAFQRLQDQPTFTASAASLEKLPQVWRELLNRLLPVWYNLAQAEIEDMEKLQEPWQIPWEQERKLISAWELGLIEEMKHGLHAIWTHMSDHHIPVVQVKRYAIHLLDQYKRTQNIQGDLSNKQIVAESKQHAELLQALILTLTEDMEIRREKSAPVTDHPEINRIVRYVHENYEANIGLKTAAAYVNMDENYLSGLFKRKTSYTLIHYLQKVRIEQAMRYLENTELTVSDIAASVGFGHDHYFIKVFKKVSGLTPNEYRKVKKGQ